MQDGSQDPGRYQLPERIRVNSQIIINTLRTIGKFGGRGELPATGPITFIRPFRVLVYCDAEIRDICSRLEEELYSRLEEKRKNDAENVSAAPIPVEKLALMKCLREFLDVHIAPRIRHVTDLHCMRIYFEDLWFLFRPGDDVVKIYADGQLNDM